MTEPTKRQKSIGPDLLTHNRIAALSWLFNRSIVDQLREWCDVTEAALTPEQMERYQARLEYLKEQS